MVLKTKGTLTNPETAFDTLCKFKGLTTIAICVALKKTKQLLWINFQQVT